MTTEKKFCRRCHKLKAVTNKSLKYCRACMDKINNRYIYPKVLPYPERYEDIITMALETHMTQRQIANAAGYSLNAIQGILARYIVMVDKDGNERPK